MADTVLPAPPPLASTAYPWWVLPGLAAMVLVVYAGALAASCVLADTTLRTQMFTGAYGLATLAIGYFFGSSAGSAKKDDAIAASGMAKDATIASNAASLASSTPIAATTTTEVDAKAGTTAPAPSPTIVQPT